MEAVQAISPKGRHLGDASVTMSIAAGSYERFVFVYSYDRLVSLWSSRLDQHNSVDLEQSHGIQKPDTLKTLGSCSMKRPSTEMCNHMHAQLVLLSINCLISAIVTVSSVRSCALSTKLLNYMAWTLAIRVDSWFCTVDQLYECGRWVLVWQSMCNLAGWEHRRWRSTYTNRHVCSTLGRRLHNWPPGAIHLSS